MYLDLSFFTRSILLSFNYICEYGKTYPKRPLKNRQNNDLKDKR